MARSRSGWERGSGELNEGRRTVLKTGVAGAFAIPLADRAAAQADNVAASGTTKTSVVIAINGQRYERLIDVRTTLVDFIRTEAGLAGTKIGCNHGQCGACTVQLEGRRVNSCLLLAVSADGNAVTTIEGLGGGSAPLHEMQRAFIAHDAFQCGYCTPGQIVSAVACIEEGHAGSAGEIREYMSGNLCRCGAYPNIVAAIEAVRDGDVPAINGEEA